MRTKTVGVRPIYRITTFVPPEHLEALLDGVEAEVPLIFGKYDRSAWWWATGIEQFRPLPGATPTVGKVGLVERVATVRVEFAIPRDSELLERVLSRGVTPHHPWEEPAIFVDECFASATEMVDSRLPA